MRVKSRNPLAEYLRISELGDQAQVERRANDGVCDQMGDMAGDGQDQIVMLRRHDLDVGAKRLPEPRQALDRGRLGVFRRCEDAPAVDEKLGEAGVGAGVLGAGDRMRGNEIDTGRHVRRQVAKHGSFDGADIRQDGARFEVGADFAGDGAECADRDAEDHQVGVGNRGGGGIDDLIDNAQLLDALPCRFGPRCRHDGLDDTERARCACDRRADQADADQRQAIE